MKLFKVLTPVLLSSVLAFPAFAAEDQNAQMQGQQQAYDQQSNANQNQQIAASDDSQANENGQKTKTMYHKGYKCKCTKSMHKKHARKNANRNNDDQSQQQTSAADNPEGQQQQAQQQQNQAPNQNS